ncbi:MAG: DUF1565 domain-containing protein, partial [Thermoguttaceae bacterium]
MKRVLIPFFVLIFTAAFCMQLFAEQKLYVSPDGNDANSGTQEKPFLTIQKAVDSLKAGESSKIITLAIGSYEIDKPIIIPADKATKLSIYGNQVKTDGESTISGGKKITGWKPVNGKVNGMSTNVKNLVVADVPEAKDVKWDFHDLYVNDKRATRARHPNSDYFRIEKSGEDRRTNFIYNEGDLKNWTDLENVELVFLHDWSITRCPV